MRFLLAAVLTILTSLPAIADDDRYVMHRFDETYLLDKHTGKTWVLSGSGRWTTVPFSVEAADAGPTVPGGKAVRETRLKRWEKDGNERRMPAAKGGQVQDEGAKRNSEALKVLKEIIR